MKLSTKGNRIEELEIRVMKENEADQLEVRFFKTPAGDIAVEEVGAKGLAAKAKLAANDTILSINGERPTDVKDASTMLRSPKGEIVMKVQRDSASSAPRTKSPSRPARSPASGGTDPFTTLGPSMAVPPLKLAPDAASHPVAGPLTARAMKSSMQLHKELRGAGRTLERMATRVDQCMQVVTGTRFELSAAVDSVRQRLQTNPSLAEDPHGPAAQAAASAAVRDDVIEAGLHARFGREPTPGELAIELRLARIKERKRREAVNTPVVEAMQELEEIAELGSNSMAQHEVKLEMCREKLRAIYTTLGTHYYEHEGVVRTNDRSRIGRVMDHHTHEALAVAAECDDFCRVTINAALKAARGERSQLEVCKADLQRAMLARTRALEEYKRMDKAGTTFKSWNSEELKRGGGAGGP